MSRCCVLAASILTWHRVALAGRNSAVGSFWTDEIEIAIAGALATLCAYFFIRGCERCRPGSYRRILLDEMIAAGAGVLVLGALSIVQPVERVLVTEGNFQELDGSRSSQHLVLAQLALSQLIALLLLLAVPMRSPIFALLLVASLGLTHALDTVGCAFRLLCLVVPIFYMISRSRECKSRQSFVYFFESEELAMALREKEKEAKSNMTLARGMQSLAGRRSDLVLVLTSQLTVWRSTALQDLFFKQDMDGTSFLDILPSHEHEPFLRTARRVREHKAGESIPLTLPRGYAKIILEYAGNEDDRYVMSILLDESADEAFRHDQCAPLRISSSKGYDPSRRHEYASSDHSSGRLRGKVPLPPLDDIDDSLCYSQSLKRSAAGSIEESEFSDLETFTTIRDLGSETDVPRKRGREVEVQVNLQTMNSTSEGIQTDLHFTRDELVCSQCSRARPPRPPTDALTDLRALKVRKRRTRSRSSSRSSSPACDSPRSDLGGSSSPETPAPTLLEACEKLALLRLTAPRWPRTSPACVATSMLWLLKHWNFTYLTIQCCPFHAALGVAFQLLKQKKKEPCNPLWSPFTGWQCDFCTGMNHENSAVCDLCGSSRTAAMDGSGPRSTSLSHLSSKSATNSSEHLPSAGWQL